VRSPCDANLTGLDERTKHASPPQVLSQASATVGVLRVTAMLRLRFNFEVRLLHLVEWKLTFKQDVAAFAGIPIDGLRSGLSQGFAGAAENSGHNGANTFDAFGLLKPETLNRFRLPLALRCLSRRERADPSFLTMAPLRSLIFRAGGAQRGGRQALMNSPAVPEAIRRLSVGRQSSVLQNYLATIAQGYLLRRSTAMWMGKIHPSSR